MNTVKFKIDGYDFSERTFEGVPFLCTIDKDTGECVDVKLSGAFSEKDDPAFWTGFDKAYWIERCKESAESTYEEIVSIEEADGEVVEYEDGWPQL